MDERHSKYEIKISRNGHPVPVIDGYHLHSIFNPIKEAEALGQNYLDTIKSKNKYLFLGLGFGYHIDEIIKVAGQFHHEISILIIEPNKQLISDYLNEVGEQKKDAIIHYNTIEEYFSDGNLMEFLMLKPAVIKHDPAFEINKCFFTRFLGHKPNQIISSYLGLLDQGDFKNYLTTYSGVNFNQLIANIKNTKKVNNKNDFIALALNELVHAKY